jgi:pimeloyl-ACP methyl ester carboxylesterase
VAISQELGAARTVDLPQGTLTYRERGRGPALLLIHGLWVNADHWRRLVPRLSQRYRCVAPDLPMGGHAVAMPKADTSPAGVARILHDLMAALDLDDVTVVAGDTGAGVAQILVTRHPERVGRLVLLPGDAFTNFLAYLLKPMRLAAFFAPAMVPVAHFWHTRLGQRLLWAFLTRNPPPPEVNESYFEPATRDPGVRADVAEFLRGCRPSLTLRAARELRRFDRPALVVWTRRRSIVFPMRHGRRLARILPDARFVEVEGSLAFVNEDRPDRLAELIEDFVPAPG